MYYASIDGKGALLGFYHEAVHGPVQMQEPGWAPPAGNPEAVAPMVPNPNTKIPAGAVALTDAQWTEWAASPHGYAWQNGALVPSVPSLASVQALQVATLRQACAAAIVAGFQSAALGAAHSYPSTPIDQQNLAASVVASMLPNLPANWTTPFWCADANGNWALVPHTAAQIQQAGLDAKAFVVAQQQKLAQLIAQVQAAATAAAVSQVNW